MPNVEVYFLPTETNESTFENCSAVIVDLLRASTTIATAFENGARAVIPAATPERATDLREQIGRTSTLLCGERLGKMIPGFDLGNSPLDYVRPAVGGKTLLYASSNGSGAILAARAAARLAVGALVNARRLVDWVGAADLDCVILCAGKLGRYGAEDAACAGFLAGALERQGFRPANDGARTAQLLCHEINGNWLDFIAATDHGRYLAELGFAADFPVTAAIDSINSLPVWNENRLTRLEDTPEG